ncbi:MAG: IS3 family transposase [Nitrosomonas sp.]|nr:IS3 family transposase [Nitrosomonas sp.]
MMVTFVDSNKAEYGVEPICRQIQIAPSSYYEHKVRERDPDRLPDRIKRDMRLELDIQRVWKDNFRVYGARKVWRQLLREGIGVARCTIERLMKKLGIQGVRRGKKCWTTISDDLLDRPTDKVNRQFVAARPNQLWVADITFVSTWIGFVYVAFITVSLQPHHLPTFLQQCFNILRCKRQQFIDSAVRPGGEFFQGIG